ncbi:MAG: hypothetical protein ABJL67_09725 [Sulfitobacter sp.]
MTPSNVLEQRIKSPKGEFGFGGGYKGEGKEDNCCDLFETVDGLDQLLGNSSGVMTRVVAS